MCYAHCVCDISMCSCHSQVIVQDCQKLTYRKGSTRVGQITFIHHAVVFCCTCTCMYVVCLHVCTLPCPTHFLQCASLVSQVYLFMLLVLSVHI